MMGAGREVAAALVAASLTAATAAPASASPQEGQWWREAMGVPTAHETVTGEGVTIALLDAQVYADAPELRGQDLVPSGTHCRQPAAERYGDPSLPEGPISPDTAHTTSMAALLVGNGEGIAGIAPDATVLTYAVAETSEDDATGQALLSCRHGERDDAEFLREVLAEDPDIVLVPIDWRPLAQDVVEEAIAEGVIFVAGAGNDGPGSQITGMGSFHGVVNAVAGDRDGVFWDGNSADILPVYYLTEDGRLTEDADEAVRLAPDESSERRPTILTPGVDIMGGGYVDGRWEPQVLQSGTSGAAALTAGALALVMERWPEATGHQVLQSMVRNANRTFEPGYDRYYGFGGLSLSSLLDQDPTVYPDVHPYYGGLRWAFEDDPPDPVVPARGQDGAMEPWQPTYAAHELDLPYPQGPQAPSEAPAAPPSSDPAAAEDPSAGAAATSAAAASPSGDGAPWGWIAGGGLLALLAAAVLLRRRAAPAHAGGEQGAGEQGPASAGQDRTVGEGDQR